ncbi:class I adenylate-forming enzyme family protein [Psychrobacillus sp. NPDC096426]|uniref:class I adenylate-forming enzyme family protein n=1 Tax=Psychrobacillus sp. NPDC096426 TaxID=3364491 RepID=UPI0038186CA4
MVQKIKLEKSIERLLSREDIRLKREQVEEYLSSGQWGVETYVDYLEHHAKRNPNKVVITDDNGKNTTYAELNKKTDQLALAFLELGLQPGDRIAVQLPNCSELVVTLMGAAKAGIIPVFCHMPYIEHDLDYIIGLTESKAMIIPDRFKNKDYIQMIKNLQEKHECLEHVIVVSDKLYEGTINFYSLLQKESKSSSFELNKVRPVGTDPFYILFTSGTTGKPKAVFHLHANNLFFTKKINDSLNVPNDEKLLLATPMAHLVGLALGALTTIQRGGTVVLLSSWNAAKAMELIENEKPSYFVGATPMLIDLAGSENRDFSSLTNIVYAGAPCPAKILNVYTQEYNCEITAFYGYSEAGITHGTRAGDDTSITSKTFGKVVDGIEAKVVDEFGNELQGPCEGEVMTRGANFIPGYYRQPENNRKMFDEEGWFHSSDVVSMDEKGYCTFLGRADDLINRGGYKIDPREIEEALYTHPNISQVAVIAMPDERLGERIAAFIILKNSLEGLELEDVTQFLDKKGLSNKRWPEAIKIVESFPMTPSGKIQRFVMRQQAKELNSVEKFV